MELEDSDCGLPLCRHGDDARGASIDHWSVGCDAYVNLTPACVVDGASPPAAAREAIVCEGKGNN